MRLYTFIVVLFITLQLTAQQFVFPGDADNNGVVDHHDVLSIGFAFGSLGPPRAPGSISTPQQIVAPWFRAFPGGRNFAYADANGNGQVDLPDFAVHSLNQGEMVGETIESFFAEGEYGFDPSIEINNNQDLDPELVSGSIVSLPIRFRNFGQETDVNGLAFTISYDSEYISEASFTFSDEWLNNDGEAFQFQDSAEGEIRVAATRLGANSLTSEGIIGTLDAVIVIDLVGLLPNDNSGNVPFVGVTGIQVVDGEFHPVLTGSHNLYFSGNDAVATNEDEIPSQAFHGTISPNPTSGNFRVLASQAFNKIDLLDVTGKSQSLYEGYPRESWLAENDLHLPSGLYYLRLSGEKGLCILPIVIH
ncbi:MAG: cohesin domain-containing protein [Bacteroidota bacterium]